MLGSPQGSNARGATIDHQFSTVIGGVNTSNAFGGGGRTFQGGLMPQEEPQLINNRNVFMQSMNNQHQFIIDSDDNSSPGRNDASSQMFKQSELVGHPNILNSKFGSVRTYSG